VRRFVETTLMRSTNHSTTTFILCGEGTGDKNLKKKEGDKYGGTAKTPVTDNELIHL
jgi:hypothetical protein